MFRTKSGEEIFVVDGHVHFWDGSDENQANIHGKQFTDCFYDYHKNLSPQEYLWPKKKFQKYEENTMIHDLFVEGYVDVAIFLPTYLTDFYKKGFNTTEQNSVVAKHYPSRFILNGAWDPRDGERGLEYLHFLKETYGIRGVKLYTAEWKGDSKGWKLSDPWAYRYLEKCESLGIINIHVHKGPTITPLNRDAFDVHDVDDAATAFPNLRFIIEHVGLPRIEDFCWIATQESNVYGGLAVAMPFIHSRPRYFAEVLAELLYWIGEDKLVFASDYAIWRPKWLIEKFIDFEMPEDLQKETGKTLTLAGKKKILGENAARLYSIDIEKKKTELRSQSLKGVAAD